MQTIFSVSQNHSITTATIKYTSFKQEEINMLQRICMLFCAFSLIAATAFAQPAPAQGPPPTGSGPYPAVMEGDPGVPGHTIYRPENLSSFDKKNPLPVVAWGNGGCANSNQFYIPFLAEIASQGFLVVAIGPYSAPGGASARGGMGGGMGGGTKSAQLLEALDWATAENQRKDSKYYGKVDPSKFAVFGHSCGGLQALEVSPDPRVSSILVMDSGLVRAGRSAQNGSSESRTASSGRSSTAGSASGRSAAGENAAGRHDDGNARSREGSPPEIALACYIYHWRGEGYCLSASDRRLCED